MCPCASHADGRALRQNAPHERPPGRPRMTTLAAEPPVRPALPDSAADAVYRKVAVRLIPLLFLCYIAAYLDRVNVSFAKLQMQQALQLSESVYGVGAGIFFIGYFIFEIPSNVML